MGIFTKFYRHRHNYWSLSKFAKYIEKRVGVTSPHSATAKGWEDFNLEYKTNHPYVYWFVNDFLKTMQNIVYYPIDVWRNIESYINNRFIHKTHIVKVSECIGEWTEWDNRMFFALFNLLVDFVEIDAASNAYWFMPKEERKKINYHSKIKEILTGKPWRSPELGLEYLKYHAYAKYVEDKFGEIHESSYKMAEIMRLYLWYKDFLKANEDGFDFDEKEDELTDKMITLIGLRKYMWV